MTKMVNELLIVFFQTTQSAGGGPRGQPTNTNAPFC